MRICFDIDNTICEEKRKGLSYEEYANVKPIQSMVDYLNKMYDEGHYIILNTARHMASTNSNLGLINARIGKITLDWLEKHGIKYHEIYFSKPYADIYIDDKAVLPQEAILISKLNDEDIQEYLKTSNKSFEHHNNK